MSSVAEASAAATPAFDCCFSLHAIGTILVSLDHGDTVTPPPLPLIHPSISSKSVVVVVVVAVVAVDEVDADRNGGKGAADLYDLLFVSPAAVCLRSIRLNGIGYLDGLSSVGLLLALVSVLSHPILTFGCL